MIREVKTLVLRRVPPGDKWEDVNERSDVFPSLTSGLEYVFQKSKGKSTEFHLSSLQGEIYVVNKQEEPDPEPEPEPKYTMYGESL